MGAHFSKTQSPLTRGIVGLPPNRAPCLRKVGAKERRGRGEREERERGERKEREGRRERVCVSRSFRSASSLFPLPPLKPKPQDGRLSADHAGLQTPRAARARPPQEGARERGRSHRVRTDGLAARWCKLSANNTDQALLSTCGFVIFCPP